MAGEIWGWIKEQCTAFLGWLGRMAMRLWRALMGQLRLVGWARWRVILASLPVIFFLYIMVGMAFMHRMGDDLSFKATPPAGVPQ